MKFLARLRARLRREPSPVVRAARPSVPLVPLNATVDAVCRNCLHFSNDPAVIETAMPGLVALGSGDASVRGDDGLCFKHDRFVTTGSHCAFFRKRLAHSTASGSAR